MSAIEASRIARKPITIPQGVDLALNDGSLSIKGPKGRTVLPIDQQIDVVIEDGKVKVKRKTIKNAVRAQKGTEKKFISSIPGTTRAAISNAVLGVTKGFETKLVLVGVGYRAQAKGKNLSLTLGFSHPIDFVPPEGITIETPSQTEIIVKGIDKQLVGHTAALIRAYRSPEPYKGKGIRYADENVVRKETKKK